MTKPLNLHTLKQPYMKRTVIMLCCCLGLLQAAVAQQDTLPRWQISLHYGPSIPLQKFGSMDVFDAQSGFAKTGSSVSLEAGYRVGRVWGVSLMVDDEAHKVENHTVSNSLNSVNQSTAYFYGSSPWRMGKAMLGLFGEFPMGSGGHWEWTIGANAGALVTSIPSVWILEGSPSTGSPTPNGNGTYDGTYATDNGKTRMGFAYDGHLGLRFVIEKVFFDLRGDYTGASLNVPYARTSLGSQVAAGQQPTAYGTTGSGSSTQPFSSVNVTLGLGLMF